MGNKIGLIFSVVILFILVCYLAYRLFMSQRELNQIKHTLNNQSLDFHLKRIRELGYDFTLKAGNQIKALKDSKSTNKKSSKSKSFKDLIESD